ncbi:hypothetical protein [Tunturiibacter gelidiferens]|uniref:Uncharacterized protein n=1 Tax=Tunturiibacter gelidiferens TaxID=3069689 RepID=A0AAU7YVC3_9BACT
MMDRDPPDFPSPGDTLLDHATAQISIDYTLIYQTCSFPKVRITDACLACKHGSHSSPLPYGSTVTTS